MAAMGKHGMSDWEFEDVQDYAACSALGIPNEFMSPAAELACKKGRVKCYQLKRQRRSRNDIAIKHAKSAIAQQVIVRHLRLA